jgi:hypothetical protein
MLTVPAGTPLVTFAIKFSDGEVISIRFSAYRPPNDHSCNHLLDPRQWNRDPNETSGNKTHVYNAQPDQTKDCHCQKCCRNQSLSDTAPNPIHIKPVEAGCCNDQPAVPDGPRCKCLQVEWRYVCSAGLSFVEHRLHNRQVAPNL